MAVISDLRVHDILALAAEAAGRSEFLGYKAHYWSPLGPPQRDNRWLFQSCLCHPTSGLEGPSSLKQGDCHLSLQH